VAVAARVARGAGVDPLGIGVEDSYRSELDLDRFAESHDDPAGGVGEDRSGRRIGGLQLSVGEGRGGPADDDREDQRRQAAPAHAGEFPAASTPASSPSIQADDASRYYSQVIPQ
jgi:hypothetical protein